MVIPKFPQFVPLRLEDKDSYYQLIAEFPHHSDTSFATLHIWWNLEEKLSISSINENVVINYHLPGDSQNSGYSLIGRQTVDDSIQTIFNYLQSEHLPVKLVHVPEFVVEHIKHLEVFDIKEETDYHEYILDSQEAATLPGGKYANTRKKINRFLRKVEGMRLEAKPIDLSSPHAINHLLTIIHAWEEKSPWKNDPGRTEYEAIKKTLTYSSVLGIHNMGFYIDDKLCGVSFYHKSTNQQYFIMHHLKVDSSFDYIVDYIEQVMAKLAVEQNVPYINMEMDLGIAGLREHKLGLKPTHFLKKYTITPRL